VRGACLCWSTATSAPWAEVVVALVSGPVCVHLLLLLMQPLPQLSAASCGAWVNRERVGSRLLAGVALPCCGAARPCRAAGASAGPADLAAARAPLLPEHASCTGVPVIAFIQYCRAWNRLCTAVCANLCAWKGGLPLAYCVAC